MPCTERRRRRAPGRGKRAITSSGLTLIELMVALAIGSTLMIGACRIYQQSRETFRINESIARLHENARYVLDLLESDIRLAGFWGLAGDAAKIAGRAGPADPVSPLAPDRDCGPNFSLDLDRPVTASNDRYDYECRAYRNAAASADTLVLRRAAVEPAADAVPGTLYVVTGDDGAGVLIEGGALALAPAPARTEIRALVVNAYYVSRHSALDSRGNRVPSLRRKLLRGGAAGATVVDEEVLPGVEDLQVQFGVDTDRDQAVDRYLDPDDDLLDEQAAELADAPRILSVRIWLRLRSEHREPGVPPTTGLAYADRVVPVLDDGYRRLLISRTLFLRNVGRVP